MTTQSNSYSPKSDALLSIVQRQDIDELTFRSVAYLKDGVFGRRGVDADCDAFSYKVKQIYCQTLCILSDTLIVHLMCPLTTYSGIL